MSKEQKTFRYQSKGVDKGATKKQPPKGRVRVNAGDKCVAPAKSKPKKRKTVNQPDYSTLSMDHVEWCEQSFSVNQLSHHYRDSFPLLVRVANGYNGEFGLQLHKDQVLQIHSVGHQKRVTASDSEQRNITIPHDFPVQVYLPDSGETVSFTEAVEKRSLPLSVEVVGSGEGSMGRGGGGGPELGGLRRGDPLYVRACREEMFLRANTISGGWINQREVLLIPAFLPVRFLVAIGMRSATIEEWHDYQQMFARSVRHLLFNLMTGYSGIVTVNADAASPYRGTSGLQFRYSVGDYQNQPRNNNPGPSDVPYQNALPHPYQNVSRLPLTGNTDKRDKQDKSGNAPKLYENLPALNKGLYENLPVHEPEPVYAKPNKFKSLQGGSRDGGDVVNTNPNKYTSLKGDVKGSGGVGDVAPHYGGSKQESASYTNEESRSSGRKPKENSRHSNIESHYDRFIERSGDQHHLGSRSKLKESSSHHQNEGFEGGTPEQFAYDNHIQIEEAEVHPQPSRSETPFSEIDENDIPDMFNRVIQVGKESMERDRLREREKERERERDRGRKVLNPSMVRVDLADPVPPPPLRKPTPTPTPTPTSKAVNVVPPTIKSGSTLSGEKDGSSIETMDDVPDQIESLTVADVGRCLHLLNMDSHIPQFKQHQIDGKLLSDLKDTVMMSEFNFTPFNASKMLRFVRGWRPKVS